jgi:predicted RND superfamily exporter protein
MRFLDRVANVIVHRRALVQVGIAALCIGGLFAMEDLRFELTPDALVAGVAPDDPRTVEYERAFGSFSRRLLVVITARDVLEAEALGYEQQLAHWLQSRRWTRGVQSITTTPLPHRAPTVTEPTLGEIEADPETLDVPLPIGPIPEALDAVARTAPNRFPHGLRSIVEHWGGAPLVVEPLASADLEEEDIRRIEATVEEGGLFARSLVAEDRHALSISADLATSSELEAEHAARALAAHLETVETPPGVTASVSGLPYVRARLVDALSDDWGLLIALACLGSIAMLAMGFRSVAGVVLPMAAVGITLAIVIGAMALSDIPIDLLTNIVPPLLITIGLGDGVHLIARYRDERRDGEAPLPAARRTLSAMAVACFMTSITTAVGFGSLAISQTEMLRRFGLLAAGAVMVAYLVTVVFLPSALPAFPGERELRQSQSKYRVLDMAVEALLGGTLRRPKTVLFVSGVLLVLCVAAASRVRVDGALLDQFEGSSDVIRTTRVVERHLGGVRSLSVAARAPEGSSLLSPEPLAALERIAAGLREEPGVLRVTSPSDVLRETWVTATDDASAADEALDTTARIEALAGLSRATTGEGERAPLDRFVTRDGRLARVEARLADLGIRHINGIIDRLEVELANEESFEAFVTGEAHRASRGLDLVVNDLMYSLGLAVVIIFAIIGLLFRSLRLALLSIPPNVLPLAAVLGWMSVRGIPLHAATVIVFGVCIGLAVDGTIHVLSRYRERLSSCSVTEAIRSAIRESGRAIVLSSTALLLGFAALQVSGFIPIRRFGELSIVAIVAALIAELTLLPALLTLFRGRRGTTR